MYRRSCRQAVTAALSRGGVCAAPSRVSDATVRAARMRAVERCGTGTTPVRGHGTRGGARWTCSVAGGLYLVPMPRLSLLARLGLDRAELRAWAMYDWAASSMQTTI